MRFSISLRIEFLFLCAYIRTSLFLSAIIRYQEISMASRKFCLL